MRLIRSSSPGDQPDRRFAFGRVVAHELQMAAHDGDGGTQFVPRVVENSRWAAKRPLQPVEHAVERLGEGGYVVVAVHRDPACEVASPIRSAVDGPHWRQDPSCHEPADRSRDDQHADPD